MKSTLEDFRDKLIENGRTFSDDEFKEMYSILEFLRGNKELDHQIMRNAAKTIKTIQPSILLDDFKIAMSMVYSVVTNAIYYLKKNGYMKIKKEEKRMAKKEDQNVDVSPEFQRVLSSIDDWVKANNGRVSFVASFTVFDEKGNVIDKDDRLLAFGHKDICEIHLDGLKEEIDKEKDDAFVNW